MDGVDIFDIEMTRLSRDGLTFVAKNGEFLFLICVCRPLQRAVMT